jgi:hypothetical protein
MTARDRARGWLIAPPPSPPSAPGARPTWYSAPSAGPPDPVGGAAPTDRASVRDPLRDDPAATSARATTRGWQPPVAGDPLVAAAETVRLGWRPPVAAESIAAPPDAVAAAVTSAAVLGRPGEVEPIAAALALALRRETRARAAAVAVVGPAPPETAEGMSARAAARRLGARLDAHGLEARVRGRLAWVWLDPEDPQLGSASRRVTLVAAPAVLAITAPRTAAIDEALAEQHLLVIVAADPEGPLARLAAAGLDRVPIVVARPIGRGLSRSLARAGVRASGPVRALLATVPEPGS